MYKKEIELSGKKTRWKKAFQSSRDYFFMYIIETISIWSARKGGVVKSSNCNLFLPKNYDNNGTTISRRLFSFLNFKFNLILKLESKRALRNFNIQCLFKY